MIFQDSLKQIVKNACMPFGVYELFRAVQIKEIEHRVAIQPKRKFTGELHTTTMIYRTIHFPENPEGSFVYEMTRARLQWMIDHPLKWMVSIFVSVYTLSPHGAIA